MYDNSESASIAISQLHGSSSTGLTLEGKELVVRFLVPLKTSLKTKLEICGKQTACYNWRTTGCDRRDDKCGFSHPKADYQVDLHPFKLEAKRETQKQVIKEPEIKEILNASADNISISKNAIRPANLKRIRASRRPPKCEFSFKPMTK